MTDRPALRPGQLVRYQFPNGSAIEGHIRHAGDGEPWLDCGIGPDSRLLWLNEPNGLLAGATPTVLREPPRPSEPEGLGAVVRDGEGGIWVRHDEARHLTWLSLSRARWRNWNDLIDPVVLSEGWTDGQ